MVDELQVIPSRIDAPLVNIQAPDLSKLGQAAAALGSVAQEAFQAVNLEEQRKAGEAQALAGTAKKQLMPAFGKAQQVFNKAVADTEARQLARDARQMMQEAYVAASDPEKFNADTPGKFMEVVQGISQGVFSNARDENRALVAQSINETADHFAGLMLQDTQKWQNAEMSAMANAELNEVIAAKQEAVISGDTAEASRLGARLSKIIDDYSSMSNTVRRQAPELRKKIEDAEKQDQIIGEYVRAEAEGLGAEFLSSFQANKPDHMTYDQWQKTAKELIRIKNMNDSLKTQANNDEYALALRDVDQGLITSVDEVQGNDVLSEMQKTKLIHQIDEKNAKTEAALQQLKEDQANIVFGRSSLIPSDRVNKYASIAFDKTQAGNEDNLPPTLSQMGASIMGAPGAVPVSGIEGIPLGTNVPKFDSLMSSYITGDNPTRQAEAVATYKTMVKADPNSVNLSGDALSIASTAMDLLNGNLEQDQELLKNVSKNVLHKTDADISERRNNFNNTIAKKAPEFFKEDMDLEVNPGLTDAALGTYRKYLNEFYISNGDINGARKAAKQSMHNWSTSGLGREGVVMQDPPENLPISSVGNALEVQFNIATQELITRNKKQRELGMAVPTIEWSDPKQAFDPSKMTEEDRIYGDREVTFSPTGALVKKRGIKVNGFDTTLTIQSGPDVRSGPPGTFTYTMQYVDPFDQAQDVSDPNSPTGAARFIPQPAEVYVPEFAKRQEDRRLDEEWKSIMLKQLSAEEQGRMRKGIPANTDLLRRRLDIIQGKEKRPVKVEGEEDGR